MKATADTERAAILAVLDRWIRQRPGLEFGNYGDVRAYNSELRSIGRDLREARTLLRAVEWRDSIDADALKAAFRAYSGRLSVTTALAHPVCRVCNQTHCNDGDHYDPSDNEYSARLDYVTGQYWPTEYRRAACAVLASALWDHARQSMPEPKGKLTRTHGDFTTEHDNIDGLTPGDWLRRYFRREFGRGIASRWFN